MSWPTRGMAVPGFSHSTEGISNGDAAKGSSSFLTHDGGDACDRGMVSHERSPSACCLSWRRKYVMGLGRVKTPISTFHHVLPPS